MQKLLSVVFVSFVLFASCTKKSELAPAPEAAKPPAASRTVNLAIWSNYVSPELVQEFEKKTGIKVQVSNYSSNEELLAKLQAGASGYDVAVPSDYMVFAMNQLRLLESLDRARLSNFKELDPKFLKKGFDPENKVSVPYDWGTTGIAINRSVYKGELKGWKDLFGKADLAGKFTLLDDVRETMGAALKAQGLSLNAKNPADLEKAKALLMKVRSRVKAFSSEPMVPLSSGETLIAHAYSSDALQAAKRTGGKIEYIIPEEGCTMYIDNLVIPKGAKNIQEAHEFINFLMEPKSSASTVMNIMVAPANLGTFALLPKELQSNRSLFPSDAALKKCEMIEDLGDGLAAWDRIWTEVKASSE